MGLDKKLSPPTKRKPRCPHRHLCCWGHPVHCHPCCSSIEQKSMEDSMSIMGPCHEASVESLEETLETLEESSEEETESASSQETEESQTDTSHSGTVFPNKSRGWEMWEGVVMSVSHHICREILIPASYCYFCFHSSAVLLLIWCLLVPPDVCLGLMKRFSFRRSCSSDCYLKRLHC